MTKKDRKYNNSVAQDAFEVALERVERAKLVVRALAFVRNTISECNRNYPQYDEDSLRKAHSVVGQLELDQWRRLFALVATVQLTPEIHEKVKRLALERFFQKDTMIGEYLKMGFENTPWLDEAENALRKEFAKEAKNSGLNPERFMG